MVIKTCGYATPAEPDLSIRKAGSLNISTFLAAIVGARRRYPEVLLDTGPYASGGSVAGVSAGTSAGKYPSSQQKPRFCEQATFGGLKVDWINTSNLILLSEDAVFGHMAYSRLFNNVNKKLEDAFDYSAVAHVRPAYLFGADADNGATRLTALDSPIPPTHPLSVQLAVSLDKEPTVTLGLDGEVMFGYAQVFYNGIGTFFSEGAPPIATNFRNGADSPTIVGVVSGVASPGNDTESYGKVASKIVVSDLAADRGLQAAEVISLFPGRASGDASIASRGDVQREADGNRVSDRQARQRLITRLVAALAALSQEDTPTEWALIQRGLGRAYLKNEPEGQTCSIEQAIVCFRAALKIFACQDDRREWSVTQGDLAQAYRSRVLGDRADNLELALQCLEDSGAVASPSTDPARIFDKQAAWDAL